MASASPLAALIMANLIGAVLFPVLWLALYLWQRRHKLPRLSAVSLLLLTSPAVIAGLFYLPVESGTALAAFTLFLPLNVLVFLFALGTSLVVLRRAT